MVFSNTTLAHGDNLRRILTNFQDQELSHSMFLTWHCKYASSREKKKKRSLNTCFQQLDLHIIRCVKDTEDSVLVKREDAS